MTVILDASALVAVIKRERGADVVLAPGQRYQMSAVNYGEVLTKVVELGGLIEDVREVIAPMRITIHPFDEIQAEEVARLRPLTRHLGRSFGDRACLALARSMHLPVLTSDSKWAELDIGVDFRFFRSSERGFS